MIRLSKLGAALVILISLTAIALLAEILYVLWRRRIFFRRRNNRRDLNQRDVDFVAHPKLSIPFLSKELLRYMCCKHQCRIEPNEATRASSTRSSSASSATSSPSSPQEHDDEFVKWCGRIGLLFTIKEEESEDVDSENGSSVENRSSSSFKTKIFAVDDESSEEVASDTTKETAKTLPEAIIYMNETTPFSTPCASPPYLTPPSSPSRDVESGTPSSGMPFSLRDSMSKNDLAKPWSVNQLTAITGETSKS